MVDQGDGERREVRSPDIGDLARLARALAAADARYVLIGGFAVTATASPAPPVTSTCSSDPSPDNVERLKRALAVLEDNAAADIDPHDLERYPVVRVADEVMIDLPAAARGVTWAEAAPRAVVAELQGQSILVADVATLIATKRTVRPADAVDREFLARLLDEC